MDEITEYVLSIGNPVMGVFRYLSLPLPSGWTLKRGEIPSEMSYSKEFNGLRWVVDGEAHHYVANLTGDDAYALTLRCSPMKNRTLSLPRGLAVWMRGSTAIAVHNGTYVIGTKSTGFFKREMMNFFKVGFSCEQTARSLELEFLGRGSRENAESLIHALQMVRCHS